MVEITLENFEQEVLKSEIPVLVEFGSSWCPPCRKLLPLLKEIEQEHPEYKICKIDIDTQSELVERYEVHSIPVCLIFHSGNLQNRFLGIVSKEKYLETLRG